MTQAEAPSRNAGGSATVDLAELAIASAALETQPATAAVRWARDAYGDRLVLAASFQDCVLIDVAMEVDPTIQVVFLDTQYHFAETLAYVDVVQARYDLDLVVMRPLIEPDDLWKTDLDECCAMRKVEPLARALDGRDAWITGLRRSESPSRAEAPIVSLDIGRGLVKVNPLAGWTDRDIEAYRIDRDLPVHPLRSQGFPSIGCEPCTQSVEPGADPRSGRWASTGKTECGLHGWS